MTSLYLVVGVPKWAQHRHVVCEPCLSVCMYVYIFACLNCMYQLWTIYLIIDLNGYNFEFQWQQQQGLLHEAVSFSEDARVFSFCPLMTRATYTEHQQWQREAQRVFIETLPEGVSWETDCSRNRNGSSVTINTPGVTSESASAVHVYGHFSCWAHGVLDQCAVSVCHKIMTCAPVQPVNWVPMFQLQSGLHTFSLCTV